MVWARSPAFEAPATSDAGTSAWLARVFDDAAANARNLVAVRGDVINVLPVEEVAQWTNPAHRVIDQWMQDLDQRGVQGRELIDSAREALTKYDRIE